MGWPSFFAAYLICVFNRPIQVLLPVIECKSNRGGFRRFCLFEAEQVRCWLGFRQRGEEGQHNERQENKHRREVRSQKAEMIEGNGGQKKETTE